APEEGSGGELLLPSTEHTTDETPEPAPKPVGGALGALLSGNPAAIPVAAGPNGDAAELTLTGDGAVLSLAIPSAGIYVLELERVDGRTFSLNASIADAEGDEAGATWWDVRWGEYQSLLNFTAKTAGSYTVSFTDVYFAGNYVENGQWMYLDEEETECTVAAKVYPALEPPAIDPGDGADENKTFSLPFFLHFTSPSDDYEVWYAVSADDYSKADDYHRYDPANPPRIFASCSVAAYTAMETDAGTLKSETVWDNYHSDMEVPTFTVNDYGFTEPFALTFEEAPQGCSLYYAVLEGEPGGGPKEQGASAVYSLYDAQNPPTISKTCEVRAYFAKQTENGEMHSGVNSAYFSHEIERAVCSADADGGYVESGGSVTLTVEDQTIEIYYALSENDWDQNYTRSQDLIANGALYTQPILIDGYENGAVLTLYYTTVKDGESNGWSETRQITVGTPPPPAPTFSPSDGEYGRVEWDKPRTVTVTSREGTNLCYTLDRGNEVMLDTNTLTLTVDRDTYIEARAYDPETEKYSEYTVTRSYLIAQPKTLTLTQSAAVEVSGTIFSTPGSEEYTLSVTQAGVYRFTCSFPGLSWYSSASATLCDAQDQVLAEIPSYDPADVSLAVGTYRLELNYSMGNYGYSEQRCELTVMKGVSAPTITPSGNYNADGGWYVGPVTLTLTADAGSEIHYTLQYYQNGWHYGEDTVYTEPLVLAYQSFSIYAYAVDGAAQSESVNANFYVRLAPPTLSPAGGAFRAPTSVALSYADESAELYYRVGYNGDYALYTEPFTVSETTYVFAYAAVGDTQSETAQEYYTIDPAPPTMNNTMRFSVRDLGTIYEGTTLAGTVDLRVNGFYDSGSGMDHADIYLKVGDGAYTYLGRADWSYLYNSYSDFLSWDTSTVAGSSAGPVDVRLLAIAYDKAGNATAVLSDLADGYDATYAPTFSVDNTDCAPLDTFTAESGAASVTLRWTREDNSYYTVYLYRAATAAALADAESFASTYYYNDSYTDRFFTAEAAGGAYYYGARVRDERNVMSEMRVLGPVGPLADANAPLVTFSAEDGAYLNARNLTVYCEDESAVTELSAVFIAADETQTVVSGSPWTFNAAYYNASVAQTVFASELAALADGAYTLRVTATDAFGNSASADLHFVKDGTAPAAPVLTVSSVPGRIDLRWTASADADVIGYRVYSSETEDGSYSYDYDSLLTERAYTYPEYGYLTPGGTRWFKIEAVDRAGNTALSAPVMGTAGEYHPAIRLATEAPRLGDDMQIAYSGFQTYEYVYFYLDGSAEYFAHGYPYNSTGEYTVTLAGDVSRRGVHTIRAVGESSGAVAQLRFAIADLAPSVTVTPATVAEGGDITVKLTGFPENRSVYFFLDPVGSDTENAPGLYYSTDYNTASIDLAYQFGDPAPGAYVLRAVESESGLTALAPLTVVSPQAALRCAAEELAPGDYVRFSATGLDSGDADLYIGGEKVATFSKYYSSDEHSGYVTIPALAADAGAVLATIVQTDSGKQASLSIPLKRSAVSVELPEESVGFESFPIRGLGFDYGERVTLYVDGASVSSSNYYSEVSFNYSFGYDAAAGRHSVELRGEQGLSAYGRVLHTDVAQTLALSDTPQLGRPLTLFASGFRAGETVAFSVNGTAVTGSASANAGGSAQFTVDALDYSPASGSYAFAAVGATSGRAAFCGTSLSANGDLTLSYSGNIRSGSSVTLTVTGLDANETADVYVNNRVLPAVTADAA
ncbi:MAG: Ig-like domain repeat protein, partial [Oscillibacter sp.]|nr:Ig-like domain repeat protein [Oscillibacter sp.]